MLLGINYFFDLVSGEAAKLPSGLFIVPSKLGFLIGGCNVLQKDDEHRSETTPVSFRTNVNMSVAALNLFSKPDTPLQVVPNLQDLWNLESLGILDDPTVNDDDQALRNFNENIKFEEGRYQLKWLWNSSEPNLPKNRNLAFKRFQNMILKNADNVEFITAYDNVIKDQLKQGVIEKVSKEDEVSGLLHYIPHQAVVTPGRTTKLRIVYDASSKSSKGLNSFNDCLYRGPILLPDLAGILIRIRNHRIALTSDIAKAFLQMSLQEDQRDVTRFFWLKDVNYQPILHPDNIQIFRFTRVLFGAKASPSMLNLTIDFHLSKYDSPVAKKVRRNIYVDNLITGTANLKEAVALYQETKVMFRDASMNIREWDSNEKVFREALPEVDQATPKSASKILGLQWNHSDDTLSVPSGKTNLTENLTKRQVVEMVSSIFDPLGFVNPVTLGCKLFIQYLWRLKLQWDDLLSDDQRERFHQLITELKDVSSFTVPRFICGLNDSKNPTTYDLLGFVDGSSQAFAAVIYLRVSTEKASEVHLIFAKTRLLPIKGLSIPRSELMGLLIGVRLIKFLSKELDLPIEKKYIWCDSQCVLHWLKSARKLPVFVENRVKEIKASKDITFCYIDTQLNPADMGTRPHNWEEFQAKRQFWLHGPQFASLSKSVWPQFNMPELTPELLDSLEQTASEKPDTVVKKQNTSAVVVSAVRKVPAIFSIQGYTVVRLLRITVVILRFLKFLIWDKLSIDTKKKQSFLGKLFNQIISVANEKEHFIRTCEMKIAQVYWERCVQKEAFPEVFQCIEQGKKHHLVKQLHLFLDQNGILRLSERLGNTELPFDAAHPKLLPSKHAFTKALINEWHQKLFHGGVQATLAAIRQEYFVLQGRRNVKHVIDQCTKCRKAYGPPYKLPDMPPLPSTRINRCRPFQFVGLDYFGPLSIKTAMEHVKIWVCLFTCFVTRAIHLEPVTDMSAEKFILCLRRYIARRGRPEKILSDNASQFKLAKKAVDQAWNSAIRNDNVMSYCGKEKIEWTFITELAPWKGGMYERMVGLVKRVIKQAIGRNIVSFETILTYLSEAEAVVNSRPMTYIYEDGKSLRILRPIDFLLPYGAIGSEVLEENHEDPEYLPTLDSSGKILKFWRSSQRFLDKCWNFFLKEYVVALHERFQFAHKQGKSVSHLIPKPGAVVLLHEENLPRGSWKLAIIQKVFPDALGIIRSAVIQMPNKNQLTRPINCLYPLELDVEVNDEENPTNSHDGDQQEQCARITRSMARKTKKTTPPTSFNLIWSTVTLILITLSFCPTKAYGNRAKCPQNSSELPIIDSQSCVKEGIVVKKTADGFLCWTKVECEGHLKTGICGNKCTCPKWADHCSYNKVPPNVDSKMINKVLINEKPNVCSFKPSPVCNEKPSQERFSQIQLYNGSKYLVKELSVQIAEATKERYECVGTGEQTGTSAFCDHHQCAEKGTKFYFFKQPDMAFFVSKEGKVPIVAWGSILQKFYGEKTALRTSPSCQECKLTCIQGGVELTLTQNIDQASVCATTLICYTLGQPRTKETVLFPSEINLEDHDVQVKIWSAGILIKHLGITCEAQPFCESIKCYFCSIRIANPQCTPYTFIFVLFIMLWFGSVTLLVLLKLLKYTALILITCFKMIEKCCSKIVHWFLMRRKQALTEPKRKRNQSTKHQMAPQPLSSSYGSFNSNKKKSSRKSKRSSYLPRSQQHLETVAFVTVLLVGILAYGYCCSQATTMTGTSKTCDIVEDPDFNSVKECVFNEVHRLALAARSRNLFVDSETEQRTTGNAQSSN